MKKKIFEAFGLILKQKKQLIAPTSPDRCAARFCGEDMNGDIWVAEKLFESQEIRRESIGFLLHELNNEGFMEACAFRPVINAPANDSLQYCASVDGSLWQLMPYVSGIDLPRPEYLGDEILGKSAGLLLVKFRNAAKRVEAANNEIIMQANSRLDLEEYCHTLAENAASRNAKTYRHIKPVLEHLQPFFCALPSLPTHLCHGDVHPMNVIWGEDKTKALIDWEFVGIRPELYDAANCIGCAGFENPAAFSGGFVPAMMGVLRKHDFATSESWRWFLHLIITIRFAWLAEWLRKGDKDMHSMELDYLDILLRVSVEEERYRAKG
ncbi:MAG: phosphotransferase [Desulfovibrio sp.]